MQNSFGRLEHSNFKCSPIFQKSSTDQSKREEGNPLLQNFPYNSMMRNKAAKINSNFDGISLSDVMTPVHRQDEGPSQGQNKEEVAEASEIGSENQSQPANVFSRRSGADSSFLLNYAEATSKREQDLSTPFKPGLSGSINRPDSNLKPQSSIFGRNYASTNEGKSSYHLPVPFAINSFPAAQKFPYNSNNISSLISKNLPKAHIREVIKQSDYDKKYSSQKSYKNEDEADISSESEVESQESYSYEESEPEEFNIQQASMRNNFSSNKPTKIKTISEVTEILKSKNKSPAGFEQEHFQSPGISDFLSHKRYSAPRKSVDSNKNEKKIKSIKNIVDSTISRKLKEEKNQMRRFDKKDAEAKIYKLKSIEANRFTKKIVEDSMQKSINDTQEGYDVYRKRSNDQKLFTKKRKLTRSKKSELTKAEIQMIEKDPMSIDQIEYLLKEIPETEEMNISCNLVNPEFKNEYLQYMTKGKSNEIKLSFNRNPLIIYQELTDWLLKEKRKLDEGSVIIEEISSTTDFCQKILDEMNEISHLTSTLPVIKSPEDENTKKKKKKVKPNNDDDGKKFKCEVCEREGRVQYFETGQGLGGHMSRVHKGKSEKFNRKKEIRSRREDFRKILFQAKKLIIGDRYEALIQSKNGKLEAKKIIKENRDSYRKLVRDLRKASSLRRGEALPDSESLSE